MAITKSLNKLIPLRLKPKAESRQIEIEILLV